MKSPLLLFFATCWILGEGSFARSGNGDGWFSQNPVEVWMPGDLIFSEIMFDPSPEAGLPAYEYLELYNRSGKLLNLEGMRVVAGERIMVLPAYELPAGDYLLLVYRGTAVLYTGAKHVLEFLPVRSVLLNTGMLLLLQDADGNTIDWLEYHPAMHAGEFQRQGGWSLERIDRNRPCHAEENWTSAAGPPGGSPGFRNLADGSFPDHRFPELAGIFVPDTSRILLRFSEPLDPSICMAGVLHEASGQEGDPGRYFRINQGRKIGQALWADPPFYREIQLTVEPPLQPAEMYILEIGGLLSDCSGNSLPVPRHERCAIAGPLRKGYVRINEILFNPLPLCNDFIELKQVAPIPVDLSDLWIASRSDLNGELNDVCRITGEPEIFFPGDYRVLTGDPETTLSCYRIDDAALLIGLRLPSMPDQAGRIVLLDKNMTVIDEAVYDEDMHHPLLQEHEGVSLERIGPSGWHSSAATEGYSTPGRRNTQRESDFQAVRKFRVDPDLISPDLDGINDLLHIHYEAPMAGLRINIHILDARGRLVRSIAENQLLGVENHFFWDGTGRDGRLAGTGLYLLLVEIFGMNGRLEVFKEPVIVAGGL